MGRLWSFFFELSGYHVVSYWTGWNTQKWYWGHLKIWQILCRTLYLVGTYSDEVRTKTRMSLRHIQRQSRLRLREYAHWCYMLCWNPLGSSTMAWIVQSTFTLRIVGGCYCRYVEDKIESNTILLLSLIPCHWIGRMGRCHNFTGSRKKRKRERGCRQTTPHLNERLPLCLWRDHHPLQIHVFFNIFISKLVSKTQGGFVRDTEYFQPSVSLDSLDMMWLNHVLIDEQQLWCRQINLDARSERDEEDEDLRERLIKEVSYFMTLTVSGKREINPSIDIDAIEQESICF